VQLELPFLRVSDPGPLGDSQLSPPCQPFTDPWVYFVRVCTARRYILRVQPDGALRVTVPRGGSRREAEAFVRENRHWIERERGRVRAEHAPLQWVPGTEILFRGRPVRLFVEPCAGGFTARYDDRWIAVGDLVTLREAVEADLRRVAEAELIPRLDELAAVHGLEVRRVTIRNQRSRWGSCARNGSIALNFRLVQMPSGVRDYVLIHELMHLRQQNHSRRFWRLVEAVCPSFREAERWLRTTGRSLF
jgi:predicted metal-dependent hydrolase